MMAQSGDPDTIEGTVQVTHTVSSCERCGNNHVLVRLWGLTCPNCGHVVEHTKEMQQALGIIPPQPARLLEFEAEVHKRLERYVADKVDALGMMPYSRDIGAEASDVETERKPLDVPPKLVRISGPMVGPGVLQIDTPKCGPVGTVISVEKQVNDEVRVWLVPSADDGIKVDDASPRSWGVDHADDGGPFLPLTRCGCGNFKNDLLPCKQCRPYAHADHITELHLAARRAVVVHREPGKRYVSDGDTVLVLDASALEHEVDRARRNEGAAREREGERNREVRAPLVENAKLRRRIEQLEAKGCGR